MTDTPELKPCPFCGGDVLLGYFGATPNIHCPECKYERDFYWDDNDPMPGGEAINAWNTRSDLSQAAVWEAKAESQLLWDVLYDIGYRSAAPDDLAWCQRKAREACKDTSRPDTGALDRALEKAREEGRREEREECIRIAGNRAGLADDLDEIYGSGWSKCARRIAAHIRARGEGVEG